MEPERNAPSPLIIFYCHNYILCSFSTYSYMISPQLNPIVDFYTNCISDNLSSPKLIVMTATLSTSMMIHRILLFPIVAIDNIIIPYVPLIWLVYGGSNTISFHSYNVRDSRSISLYLAIALFKLD